MKTFISTLSNTLKAVKLLSDPTFTKLIEQTMISKEAGQRFGKNDAYFHAHYIVQIVN